VAALIGLLLLALTACSQQALSSSSPQITVGLAQMPMTLDPRYATDAASERIQQFVHCRLVRLDEHFLPQGDLARSWEHPEPNLWRFHLRRHIRFHNGREVTAQDVAATLRSIIRPATASPLQSGLAAIQGIQVEDSHTLRLELSRIDTSLLSHLNVGILPADQVTHTQQARKTIGCGPYRLKQWQETILTLQAVDESKPSIRFVRVKDPVTRVLKIVRGELDLIQNDLPPYLLPYVQQQPQLHVVSRRSTTFAYLGLNLQDSILHDVRVRRALALAIDRKLLKQALFGNLPELAETVLTPSHWAATRLPVTPFHPQEAEHLLDAAGHPRQKNGIRFTLNYRTSTDPVRLQLATAIASMWRRIGVAVDIESLEWGGFYARIKRGDFQLYSLSWVGIRDPDIYRWILHSRQWPPKGANRGHYRNADVDHWLDKAAITEDIMQRRKLFARIQQQMQKDMVYIPLWFEPVIAVSNRRISGFVPRADGSYLGLMDVTLSR